MSALHHVRVRRARGLPMPPPPKPKRPLGPPVLVYWGDTPIRMRSDIERAGRTWDEFLDAMAAEEAHALSLPRFDRSMIGRGGDAVRALTPMHERADVMRDFWGRVRVAMDREGERERRKWEALASIERARLAGPPSFLSRLFGRSA